MVNDDFSGLQMLNNEDFRSLISNGVEPGMLALVESAFSVLFEAGAKRVNNDIIPFSYEKAADDLGIDTSDCRPDGKLNTSLLVRKLNSDIRFRKLDEKIGHIVKMAVDLGGLAYTDESGTTRYTYPSLEKSEEFRNIRENVKTRLMSTILDKLSGKSHDAFLDALDGIDDKRAAQKLAHGVFELVLQQVGMRRDSEIGRRSPDEADYAVDSEYDVMEKNFEILVKNEDGTAWCRRTTPDVVDADFPDDGNTTWVYLVSVDEYEILSFPRKLAVVDGYIVSDESVRVGDNSEERYNIYCIQHSAKWIPDRAIASVFSHDLANLFVSGKVKGIKDLDEMSISNFVDNMSYADIVRVLRCKDFDSSILWSTETELPSITKNTLRFLVDAVDSGALDKDDLVSMAEHVDNPAWYFNAIDPETMSLAIDYGLTDYATKSGAGYEFPSALCDIFRKSPKALIRALTGDEVSLTSAWVDESKTADTSIRTKDEWDDYRRPEVQRAIAENYGFFRLVNILRRASDVVGYIPLDRKVTENAFASEKDSKSDIALLLLRYYAVMLSRAVIGDTSDARTTAKESLQVFEEIRNNLTPAVQEAALATGDGDVKSTILGIANKVPGFIICDRLATERMETSALSSGVTTARNLIRAIRIAADRGLSRNDQLRLFWRSCMHENIVKEVTAGSELGKRVMRIFENFITSRSPSEYPTGKFDVLRFSWLYEEFDSSRLPDYIRTYVMPSWKSIAYVDADMTAVDIVDSNIFLSDVIRTYGETFNLDETVAVKAFLDRKSGIFKCSSAVLTDVPSADGNPGKKKMVQHDERQVRLNLMRALGENCPRISQRAFIALVGTTIAGQRLIVDVMENGGDALESLFYVDSKYGKPEEGASVLDANDLNELVKSNPVAVLKCIGCMGKEMATEICRTCFTPDVVRSMSTTTPGLELLLRLSELGDWNLFTQQFVTANQLRIDALLDTLPTQEADRIRKRLADIRGKGGVTEFGSVGGTEQSATLGSKVDYHEANGLRWMSTYVRTPGAKLQSPDQRAGLYTKQQAEEFVKHLGPDGWRLPTVAELEHLGEDPKAIARKQLGFTPTGRADSSGKLVPGSESICYAWCVGDGGVVGYSVTSNIVDTEDFDIEDGDMLAIKLVR